MLARRRSSSPRRFDGSESPRKSYGVYRMSGKQAMLSRHSGMTELTLFRSCIAPFRIDTKAATEAVERETSSEIWDLEPAKVVELEL